MLITDHGSEEHKTVDQLMEEIHNLRAKGDYYRNILESADKGVWIINNDHNTVYINYRMAEMLGYTTEEMIGEDIIIFIHEDDADRFLDMLLQCETGDTIRFDAKLNSKDGYVLWTLAGIRPFFNKEGQQIGINGTFTDITERKLMELALKETKEDLVVAQRVGRMGSWVRDLRTDKIEYSDEISSIFGVPREGISFSMLQKMVHPDDRARASEFSKSNIEGIGSGAIDFRVIRSDGKIIYCRVEAKVIPDKHGRAVKSIGILQDITERKTFEIALQDARAQAEFFIDLISHDIGNMNHAALGYLELAMDICPTEEDEKELIIKPIEIITGSTTLINDVRLLKQLRKGTVEFKKADAGATLNRILNKYSEKIKINYDPLEGCCVAAGELIDDTFSRIIDNFLEYSDPKVLKIKAYWTINKKGCIFAFEDNGPGIPDGLKKKLMSAVWDQKGVNVRRILGFQFIKTIIDACHGDIWIEDRVPGDHSKGTRLVVMLPAVEK